MKILVAHHPWDSRTAELAAAALRRSFSAAPVHVAPYAAVRGSYAAALLIRPGDAEADLLQEYRQAGRKAVVFGAVGNVVGRLLGLRPLMHPSLAELGEEARPPTAWQESPSRMRYQRGHVLSQCSPLADRPLWRFDFADEWNNLGYGQITCDGGPWSLACPFAAEEATVLAALCGSGSETRSAYATVLDLPTAALLWYNRAVGPIDGQDWRVVESFLGDYRAPELVCFPYLSEIPAGFRGGVAARLDCDEAVASARPLFDAYTAAGVPLSLAVVAGLPMGSDDFGLLRDVVAAGGSVVSHSVHHWPDWGGSYAAALAEARARKAWLEEHLPEAGPVQFAVSPFHQNSVGAVRALGDAGYRGFVGGSIRNDPEFLLGRAGSVPFVESMVSHSQQCMLHGDCYHRTGAEVYRRSFANHLHGRSIFGYLDHPFSSRYQYGWAGEEERLAAHAELLRCIRAEPDLWKPNLADCLAFLCKRAATTVELAEDGRLQIDGPDDDGLPPVAVHWKGQTVAA